MRDPEEAIEILSTSVRRTKDLLLHLRSLQGQFALTQAVARQLFFAHETGSSLLVALREAIVFGTHPLLRNLLESVVEMLLFVSWPEPGGPAAAAARSMVWDLLEWKRRRERYHETRSLAQEALPDVELEKTRDPEEILEDQVQRIAQRGGDPEPFQNAWTEFSSDRPEHWSGRETFAERVRFARDQNPGDEKIRLLSYRYEFLWGEGSYISHATPRWAIVRFGIKSDGTLEPRAERSREEQVVGQAEHGAEFLDNLRALTLRLPLKIGW